MSGIFDQIINYSPPLIVSGTVNYKGTWDASANNPTLNSSPAASTKGDYYVVSTAGTQFGITFAIGDWIISNGTAWEKVDLTDAVSSVFGRTGAVVGVSTDYSAVGLTNTAIGASNPSTGAFTTVTASSTIAATGAVTGSNLSGTNTGDQTTITGNAGSATVLQTPRAIYGNNFDGSAALTQAIAGTYGGTGVNNGANTITIAGNVTHAGAFTQSFTATANTSLTLPTTGTLSTLAGSEALSNKTITASPISGSTGSFTTLSATGAVTFDGVSFADGTAANTLVTTSGGNVGIGVTAPQQQLAIGGTNDQVGAGVSGTVSTLYFGNPSNFTGGIARLAYDRSIGTLTFTGGTIAAPVTTMTVNSVTGVAVTGSFNSGGNLSTTASTPFIVGSSATPGIIYYGSTGANSPVKTLVNNTVVTDVTSTGLAVTGSLSVVRSTSDTVAAFSRTGGNNCYITLTGGSSSDYTLELSAERTAANSGNCYFGGNHNTTFIWRQGGYATLMNLNTGGLTVTANLNVGVAGTGTNIVIKDYSAGTQRNWGIRDDSGVDRLRFSRGASDYWFWDSLKVAGSDNVDVQNWRAVSGFNWTVSSTIRTSINSTGLAVTGALSCTGALSKGSGSFRIEHPLPEKSATHQLVHSFIEGPQADLIYRGKVVLVDGKASVNIDTVATMTEGTFEVLCREVQCFTTNESGWTAVRGKVTGNILTIEAKDADCSDEISWMVIGERQDPHMMETDWTDDNGKVIVEPLKPVIESK